MNSTVKKERFAKYLSAGNTLWVSDFVVGNSDEKDRLIGNPPLHQHHFHYYHGSWKYNQDIDNHGGWDCDPSEEGVYCNLQEYPPGYAYLFGPPPFGIFTTINDVRKDGATELYSRIFTGIFLPHRDQPMRRLKQHFLMTYPWNMISIYPWLDGARPYPVNTEVESMMWSSGVIHSIEHVVTAYYHFHIDTVDEFVLLEGHPAAFHLDHEPWASARAKLLTSPYGDGLVGDFRTHLQHRLDADAGKVLCRTGREPGFDKGSRRWCEFQPGNSDALNYVVVLLFKQRNLAKKIDNPYNEHTDIRLIATLQNDSHYSEPDAGYYYYGEWHYGVPSPA